MLIVIDKLDKHTQVATYIGGKYVMAYVLSAISIAATMYIANCCLYIKTLVAKSVVILLIASYLFMM